MVDQGRLKEELRRLRELIRSDPRVLALVDRNGDGSLDGEEWEHARRCLIRRLEGEIDATAMSPAAVGVPGAGKVAREVYEEELVTLPPLHENLRLEERDHLILETPIVVSRRIKWRRSPQLMHTFRAGGHRAELGKFEQLLTYRDARRQRRNTWDDVEYHYSIRPNNQDHLRVHRRPTWLGEELEVCSVYGRAIAGIKPRSRGFKYIYGVRGEDDRSVTVQQLPWNVNCERGYRRTEGERKRPRSPRLPNPYHVVDDQGEWAGFVDSTVYVPDAKNPQELYRHWIIRLEPNSLTLPLRWGLIGTLAFILTPPSLLSGRIWYFMRTK